MTSRYLPHTSADVDALLQKIGVPSIDTLFESIPADYRLNRSLHIPRSTSEAELKRLINDLAYQNAHADRSVSFVGAGAYAHHSPVVIDALIQRGEFLTAYTPYQPEVSQGTLQAIFEYQTFISALLEMDVSNASTYDGSTALAEAVLMAERINGNKTILYSGGIHPEYLAVLKTYVKPRRFRLIELPLSPQGDLDLNTCEALIEREKPGAVVVAYPNCLGSLEDMTALSDMTHRHNALFISVTTDITVYGLLQTPGSFNADIAVAEGQGLGLPLSFGGPYLGVFATRKEYLRKMPGRLAGRSVDQSGKTAYTLTLSTREQHIRREKATSNICTNQGLCALAAMIYLGLMGKAGIEDVAEHSTRRAHGLAQKLEAANCGQLAFTAPFFHEFAWELPMPASDLVRSLSSRRVVPGFPLSRWFDGSPNRLLINTTELHTHTDIDRLVDAIADDCQRMRVL